MAFLKDRSVNVRPSSIRKDWFWSLCAEVLARLASILVIGYYFSAFGQEAAGIVVVGYSYVMTCWLLVDIGLGLYGAKEVAKEDASIQEIQVEITAARFSASLGAALLAMVLLLGIVGTSLMVAICFAGFLIIRGFSLDWLFRGTSRFKELAFINLLAGVGQLLALVLVTQSNWSETIAVPFTLWALVIAGMGWWRTATSPFLVLLALSPRSLRHLKDSIGFSLTNGASIVFQQSPVLFLSLLYTPAQLAGFAFMHRLMLSAVMLFSSLGAAIFPYLVRGSAISNTLAGKTALKAMIFIGFAAIFPAAVLAFAYTLPVLEQTYFPGLSLKIVLALAIFLVLRSMRVAPMRLLMASNKQGNAAVLNITATVFYLSMLVLVWLFGLLDFFTTALLFSITELLILIGLLFVAYKTRSE